MTRTVTALFDNRAEAEAARTRLTQSDVDVGRVQIIDKTNTSSTEATNGGGSSDGDGFWASLKSAFLPEEDSHAYEEGLRRGGYLVCAQVYENEAEQAIRILEESDSVDFDQRQEQWRGEGWSGFTGGGAQTTGSFGGQSTGSLGATSAGTTGGTAATPSSGMTAGERGNTTEEQRIPIVEEELRVGKREVSRGGARVRSYIRETPVHEQVTLREEHVSVERRPVDEKISAADLDSGDLLRDRTIEMTETAEEAVVAKEARVREELVVRKTAEDHVEQINDTVRRTEVDVDEGARGSQDRSAFGFKEGGTGTGATGSETKRTGTGATGSETKREPEPEHQGSGYTNRIDKTGL